MTVSAEAQVEPDAVAGPQLSALHELQYELACLSAQVQDICDKLRHITVPGLERRWPDIVELADLVADQTDELGAEFDEMVKAVSSGSTPPEWEGMDEENEPELEHTDIHVIQDL